jgi:hypothetical protein
VEFSDATPIEDCRVDNPVRRLDLPQSHPTETVRLHRIL